MSTHVEHIETRTATEDTLRALHQLHLARDQELEPAGDPPVPFEQRMLDWRNYWESEASPRWALWSEGLIVATSGGYLDLEQNVENAYGWVYVHPDHRMRGHGRAVASPMFDLLQADRRIRFACEVHQGRPEEAVTSRAGMKPAFTERRSRLAFQELDWGLMELWVKRAEERALDYELLELKTPLDEELVEPFCDLSFIMNTAPREEYIEEDEVLTPAVWRDIEAKHEKRQLDHLISVAVHRPSGAFAGFTEVLWHRLMPDLAWQGDTGVDPAHRNRGLGRWLKAAMAMRLRDAYPTIRRIDTYNAGSNAPMLSINVEMGFKPVQIQTVWQGDITKLRERLAV